MKRIKMISIITYLLYFILFPKTLLSQRDTIYRFDNHKIVCDITQKELFNIKYKLSTNSLVYDISTLDINKIRFKDGSLKYYINKQKYPESEKNVLINTCKGNFIDNENANRYCYCVFSKIEGTYTYNELSNYKGSDEGLLGMTQQALGQCMAEIERQDGKPTEFNCTNKEYYEHILPLKVVNQNRKCPKNLDEITRIEKLLVDSESGSIIYHYTITSITREKENIENLRKSVETFVKQNLSLKNDKSFDDFRNRNVKIINSYYDKNNIHLFDVNVDY
jgi:hypothetical protein